MKKNLKLFSVLAFLLLSTQAFAAKNDKSSVETKVASVDVHGNVNLAIKTKQFGAKGFSISDVVSVKVGDFKFTAPIVKDYSDVSNGEFLIRINGDEVSIAINMGNFSKVSGAKEGSSVSITMKDRFGYLTPYHVRLLKKSEQRENFSSDEVFANFRTVSAGKIKESTLYRSCNPIITDARAPYAAKLVEKANIKTVLNLMNSPDNFELLDNSPYYKNLSENQNVILLGMGISFSDEDFVSKLHDALSFLASHEGPYLIHGKEGKNRTGYVIAVLEALCGSSMEEITDDYMLSFTNYYGVKKDTSQYKEIAKAVDYMFAKINGGKPVTDKNIQAVTEKYLLKTVELSQSQIDSIKKNLCDI